MVKDSLYLENGANGRCEGGEGGDWLGGQAA